MVAMSQHTEAGQGIVSENHRSFTGVLPTVIFLSLCIILLMLVLNIR